MVALVRGRPDSCSGWRQARNAHRRSQRATRPAKAQAHPQDSDSSASHSNATGTVVLHEGLRLLERHEAEETAKIAALRRAADEGWDDLASGRYVDLADNDLDDFIGELGVRAAAQVLPAS